MAVSGGPDGDRPSGMLNTPDRTLGRFRPRGALVLGVVLAACCISFSLRTLAADSPGQDHAQGQPGYLVIEAARDTSEGFRWEMGPAPGHRSLVWDQGRLAIPDSTVVDFFGKHDLGLPFTEKFAGNGASGRVLLEDGIFPVSEPVVFSDGFLKLEISAGELEIRGARIRYRRSVAEPREIKSGLLLLAGMTLLVIVLLRRARLKSGERTGR